MDYSPATTNGLLPSNANDNMVMKMFFEGKAKNTITRFQFDLQDFFTFVNKPIRSVFHTDIVAYKEHLEKLNSSTALIRVRLSAIKSFYSFVAKLGYYVNVALMIKLPRKADTVFERILTIENVKSIINSERDFKYSIMLRLFYIGMLRISELSELKVKNLKFNLEGGFCQLHIFGKGGKNRFIRLENSQLVQDLHKLVSDKQSDSFVFVSNKTKSKHSENTPYNRSTIHRIFKRAVKNAGLNEKISAHWFRHTSATISLNNGAPISLISQELGHSSIATTSIYLHISPSESSNRYKGF